MVEFNSGDLPFTATKGCVKFSPSETNLEPPKALLPVPRSGFQWHSKQTPVSPEMVDSSAQRYECANRHLTSQRLLESVWDAQLPG